MISSGKEKLGFKVLNYIFGPDPTLRVIAKNSSIDADLSKYYNQFPEFVYLYSKKQYI
jgi:hypothetical protein